MKILVKIRNYAIFFLFVWITIEVVSYIQASERSKSVCVYPIIESEDVIEVDTSSLSEEDENNLLLNGILEEIYNEEN